METLRTDRLNPGNRLLAIRFPGCSTNFEFVFFCMYAILHLTSVGGTATKRRTPFSATLPIFAGG